MPAPYTGGCAGGAVTLHIAAEAFGASQCWCRNCQRICGGGPAHVAIFKAGDLAISGALRTATGTADSGNATHLNFCAACGTQIHGGSAAVPELLAVRLGALDEPHGLSPKMILWTSEAPPWAVFDPALPQFATQPSGPAE